MAGVRGPAVLGVAAGEVLAHGGPRAGPEAGQVGRDLDRAVGGREQRHRERHPAAGDRRVLAARRTRPAPAPRRSGAPRRSRSPPSRPVGSVHDRGASSSRSAPSGHGSIERSRIAEVEAVEVGPAGGAGEVRRQPLVERAEQAGVGHVRPLVAERRPQERHPGPQLRRRRRPRQHGEPGRAHPLDERRRRRLARRRPAPLLAEAQRVEASLDALDEVVGVGVPLQPAVLDRRRRAARRSRRRRRRRRGGCGRSCACRRGRRRRRTGRRRAGRRRRPRRRCRCAAGTGPAGGAPRGGRGTRRGARAPATSGSTAPASKRTPARRAMSAARSRTRSTARRSARSSRTWPHTIATRSARSAGSRSVRPRSTSRSSTTAATTHASASGRPTTMRARRGWTGRPTIDRPIGVMAPSSSSAPRSVSSSTAWRRAFAGGASTNDSCSAGVPHAASSSTNPARSTWVISAARWAGRVPCSIRLHSR